MGARRYNGAWMLGISPEERMSELKQSVGFRVGQMVWTILILSLFVAGCGEAVVTIAAGADDADLGGVGRDMGMRAEDASGDSSGDMFDLGVLDAGMDSEEMDIPNEPADMAMMGELDQGEDLPDLAEEDLGDTTPEPPKTPVIKIRFATYNVRTSNLLNDRWGDLNRGWDEKDAARMRLVADTIAGKRLTVVALQEVRKNEYQAILNRLANHHGQTWGRTTQKAGPDDTMVIFRKDIWRLTKHIHYKIPLQSQLQSRYQVGARLRHRDSGRRVWFYSVHLAAHAEGANARKVGARETVKAIKKSAVADDLPFVLGGDFNTTASSPPGKIFSDSGIMRYTRNFAKKKVKDGCKTLNSRAGTAGHQSCPGGAARHIDMVWVGKTKMKVTKHEVVATSTTSRASDHNPVVTIIEQP